MNTYEIHRIGRVIAIYQNGEFSHNLRKSDRGYEQAWNRPADWIAASVASDVAAEVYRAEVRAARLADLAPYLARRAARGLSQLSFSL